MTHGTKNWNVSYQCVGNLLTGNWNEIAIRTQQVAVATMQSEKGDILCSVMARLGSADF